MAKVLFTTEEAAKYLKVSPSFLAKDRMKGGEIPYTTVGDRMIRYDKDELDKYLERRKVSR